MQGDHNLFQSSAIFYHTYVMVKVMQALCCPPPMQDLW